MKCNATSSIVLVCCAAMLAGGMVALAAPTPTPEQKPELPDARHSAVLGKDRSALNSLYGEPVETKADGPFQVGAAHDVRYTYLTGKFKIIVETMVDGQNHDTSFLSLVCVTQDAVDSVVNAGDAPALLAVFADGCDWKPIGSAQPPTRWVRTDGKFMAWIQHGTLRVFPKPGGTPSVSAASATSTTDAPAATPSAAPVVAPLPTATTPLPSPSPAP